MYKGMVEFAAPVFDGTITFASTEFDASWQPGARLQLACPDATTIVGTVWVTGVPSEGVVIPQAQTLFEDVLSRMAYSLELAIGRSTIASSQVEPMVPPCGNIPYAGTGYLRFTGYAPSVRRSIQPDQVRQALDVQAPLGEASYSQFRSARLSAGGVEEFMSLYRILMELVGDEQRKVDMFVRSVEPTVAHAPSPHRTTQSETLYTRLRNELAHKRPGINIEATRQGMLQSLGNLRRIVREAIAQFG